MQNVPVNMPMIQPAAQNVAAPPQAQAQLAPQPQYTPTGTAGQDAYYPQEQIQQAGGTSKLSLLLQSVLQVLGVAAQGGAIGAGVGLAVSCKPPSKGAVMSQLKDVLIFRRPDDAAVSGMKAAQDVAAKIITGQITDESVIQTAANSYKIAQTNLDNAVKTISENVAKLSREAAKTDADALLVREAKKIAKGFSREGIIGMGIAIGAVGLCAYQLIKNILPAKKQEPQQQAVKQALNTVQG